jgi:hypothetical protein
MELIPFQWFMIVVLITVITTGVFLIFNIRISRVLKQIRNWSYGITKPEFKFTPRSEPPGPGPEKEERMVVSQEKKKTASEKMTDLVLTSLKEQYESGIISKETYEELQKKLRHE